MSKKTHSNQYVAKTHCTVCSKEAVYVFPIEAHPETMRCFSCESDSVRAVEYLNPEETEEIVGNPSLGHIVFLDDPARTVTSIAVQSDDESWFYREMKRK